MKILVLHDKLEGEMGGMKHFIAAQNALFRTAGWDVTEVVCTPEPQPTALHLAPSGRRSGLFAARALRGMVAANDVDVLILHSPYYALGPLVLQAIQDQLPAVYVLHDVLPWCPRGTRLTRDGKACERPQGIGCLRPACYRAGESGRFLSDTYGLLMRALQARAARSVQQWVVPSRYLAELLQLHGIDARRIALVPHFANPSLVDAGDRLRTDAVPGRLLYAGRLVPGKGVQVLLDALLRLEGTGWTLRIVGSGPERQALQDQVIRQDFGTRVRFVDSVAPEALAVEYQAAAVVVMPSLVAESFGLVGLEAMHFARPVVGFASGGMNEWLRDGVTGKVAAWGDPASLAQALQTLLADPQLAQQIGRTGQEIARREFGAAKHLELIRRVIGQVMALHAQKKPQAAARVVSP